MCLLLYQLCILESHDQVQFFLLHPSDLLFVKHLLTLLSHQAFLNLGARSVLLINKVHLPLGLRF
jgi:hypothetical protein